MRPFQEPSRQKIAPRETVLTQRYDKIMQTKCSLQFGPEMRKRRGPRGPYHEHDAGVFPILGRLFFRRN